MTRPATRLRERVHFNHLCAVQLLPSVRAAWGEVRPLFSILSQRDVSLRSNVMMLTEQTPVPEAALPLEPFKAHLRLGTGFGEDSLQDEVLISFLRAAIAAIEARTGKVLFSRQFVLNLHQWNDRAAQVLPLVPVTEVSAVVQVDAEGVEDILASSQYHLIQDSQHPKLCPTGSLFPLVVTGGALRITLTAGIATDWGGLPADLGQAGLMLASHYYQYRDDTGLSGGCMPFGVTSLIERYRVVRLGLGRMQ